MAETEKFEHYEVLKRDDGSLWELGRGAMGITYKAFDTDLLCQVALKVINPGMLSTEGMRERFLREARSAAQLRHPNIAAVYRLGKTADDTYFYAMEFCEGRTIKELVDTSGSLDPKTALEITLQVSRALICAEERHLVHRDIKPANMILTERSDEGLVVKLIDFGLAKNTAGGGGAWSSVGTQGFIGTAHFASPEQIEEKETDIRSDIYSLGATLWFMLTGNAPFEGSLARVMAQHLSTMPAFDKLGACPPDILVLLRQMLEKDPARRPQTAADLRRMVQETLLFLNSSKSLPPPLPTAGNKPAPAPAPAVKPAPAAPPPQPPAPEVFDGRISLLDLLKARGALGLSEVLRIARLIARDVDHDPGTRKKKPLLTKQAVYVDVGKKSGKTRRDLLRTPVTTWPDFEVEIERGPAAESAPPPPDAGAQELLSMPTFVPGQGGEDSVTQAAQLIYELLGGSPGGRYVPLARLDEAGNGILKRGMTAGLHENVTELVEALGASSSGHVEEIRIADEPAPIAPPPLPPPPKAQPQSPVPPQTPRQPVQPPPQTPAPVPAPVQPQQPARPLQQPRPVPSGDGGKAAVSKLILFLRETAAEFWKLPLKLRVVLGVIILLVLMGALGQLFRSDHGKSKGSHSSNTNQTNGDNRNAQNLTFSISDDLGNEQESESVTISIDGRQAGSIQVNGMQREATLNVTVSSPGSHSYSVQAVSVNRYFPPRSYGQGQGTLDIHGGEQFVLDAEDAGNGRYNVRIVPR